MRKRDEWAKHIRAWKRSGLDAAEYGKQNGIGPKKLYWWSWFLRANPARKPASRAKVTLEPIAATSLLPVRVRSPAARAGAAEPGQPARVASVDVALPSGVVIRASSSVDPTWLGQVIVAGTASC
jgi:hypothetical protein